MLEINLPNSNLNVLKDTCDEEESHGMNLVMFRRLVDSYVKHVMWIQNNEPTYGALYIINCFDSERD